MVEAVNPVRSLGRHPLFQTMVSYLGEAGGAWHLGSLRVETERVRQQVAMFDLSFDFFETRDGVRGELEYATDRWDRGSAEKLVARLHRVLAAVAADPSVVVTRIDVREPDERALPQLGTAPIPAGSIVDLFAAQVAATPGAEALVSGGRAWTFAELDEWSSRLAGSLAARGIGRGDLVALAAARPLTVPAILAVLKCGAAYLPVDAYQPAGRIAAMFADAGPALVLATAGVELPAGPERLLLDEPFDGPVAPVTSPRPDDPAYVIYTSGSTGRPKGVVVPHRGIVNLFASHRARLMPGPKRRVAHVASFTFDGSWEPLLLAARRACLARARRRRVPGSGGARATSARPARRGARRRPRLSAGADSGRGARRRAQRAAGRRRGDRSGAVAADHRHARVGVPRPVRADRGVGGRVRVERCGARAVPPGQRPDLLLDERCRPVPPGCGASCTWPGRASRTVT